MRRPYVRFAADRKAIFLKRLAQTGLVTLACERAGIHRDTAYAHRRGDADFAIGWTGAVDRFHGRLAAAAEDRRRFVDRLLGAAPAEAGR